MPSDAIRRYWDTSVFIDLLEQTPGRIERIRPIIQNAKHRSTIIITSAFTMVEVSKLTHLSEAEEKVEEMIRQFFENEYISIRNVDRFVAERARPIVRKCGVKPADAVQLATAILLDVHVMETYDSKLIKLSGLEEIGGMSVREPGL